MLAQKARNKVFAVLQKNQTVFCQELTNRKVQFYAQQLQISTKQLNRITQEIIKKPVKQYIKERLIMEIKRLLMNTDWPIKVVAYQTGFEEPTNFVKYFKKETNQTPSAFRKSF